MTAYPSSSVRFGVLFSTYISYPWTQVISAGTVMDLPVTGSLAQRVPGRLLTPHQLRHAFATICFDADLSAKDAAQLLGHSKVELTMDVYTHIRQSRAQRTAEQLNAFVSS